ncbi:hypothetical protein C5167_021475 [Papaver somniferum]|nr:hypothetical protein C5167_021475 [Papaver somniferum]
MSAHFCDNHFISWSGVVDAHMKDGVRLLNLNVDALCEMSFKVLISSTNNAFCHVDWSPVHYQEATHKFWNNKHRPCQNNELLQRDSEEGAPPPSEDKAKTTTCYNQC